MGGPVGCIVLVCLVGLALGYPSGAPDNTTVCQNLRPGHRAAPQTRPPPFTITMSEEAYVAGEEITVTVKGHDGFVFKGFMIQARRADRRLDQNEPIGFFTVIKGTKLVCADKYGNGLTHSNDGDARGPPVRNDLVLKWTAPRPAQGHVRFRITIVARYNVYWIAERSSVLRDITAPPLPPEDSFRLPSATVMPLTPISLETCGKNKGCYRDPADCSLEDSNDDNACYAVVTWQDREDYIDFELAGSAHGWVALGFSHDKLMGHDSVVQCVWNRNMHTVEIAQSYNLQGDKHNKVVLDTRTHGIENMQGLYSNGFVKCRFSRKKKVEEEIESVFDLTDKSYYLLIAKGNVTADGEKEMHSLEPYKSPMVSSSRVDFTKKANISGRARYALVKAHGCLMIIAWMMSASLGIIMARYYKRMWPNDQFCANKVWFSVHRMCQLIAMFCTIVGVILIFVHMGGWHQMPDLPAKAHPPLGITVLVLVVLNPLLAICRCHPEHKFRPVFNWIHWFIGTVCFVLQSPTLFIGLNLHKSFVPSWVTWVLVAFYLFHVIIELMLEIHGCINGHKQKQRDLEFDLRKRSDPRGELDGYEPDPVGTRFKTIIIWLYSIVMLICGILVVIGIAIG